jgi:4-hydroxybenzoate polyprenyltransferase
MTVFVAQAASPGLWPTWPVIILSVLVGVIAHLLNAVPDIDSDRRMGFGGLAVALGKRGSIALAVALMALAVASLVWVVVDVVASI